MKSPGMFFLLCDVASSHRHRHGPRACAPPCARVSVVVRKVQISPDLFHRGVVDSQDFPQPTRLSEGRRVSRSDKGAKEAVLLLMAGLK